MEKAIQRAIEGGWVEKHLVGQMTYEMNWITDAFGRERLECRDDLGSVRLLDYDRAFIDPLFWKALGKAEGWTPVSYRQTAKKDDLLYFSAKDLVPTVMEGYRYYMFRFVDHLIEGRSIDEFFNQLLK